MQTYMLPVEIIGSIHFCFSVLGLKDQIGKFKEQQDRES